MNRQLLVIGIFFLVFMLTGVTLFAADVQSSNFAQAVIVVDSFADNLTSGDSDCTLREAIMNANSNSDTTAGDCVSGSGRDTITVPVGTYTLAISGAGEDANATGDLDITEDLTINGAGSNNTIVDGNQLDRVFHVLNGAAVQINDLTITEGLVEDESGGGLLNESGFLTLTNSLVSHNVVSGTALVGGGGLANIALTANASTSLQNSEVFSNTSQAGNGGGVFATAESAMTAQLTISNTNVHNNWSLGAGGGVYAIFADLTGTEPGQTTVTIERSVINGNVAQGGGGGGVRLNGNIGQLKSTIVDSMVSNNVSEGALGGVGGGMYTAGETLVLRSVVVGNKATKSVEGSLGSGGGIGNFGALEIANSTISDNHADVEGAIGFLEGIGGGVASISLFTITNSTVANNTASAAGGGIATLTLGDMATTTFENSIVADNGAPSDASCTNFSSVQNSRGYNLEDENSCNFTATGDKINTNPLLGLLQDNGGDTLTHALLFDSPAIDAGNCPGTITDQRGLSRPVDIPNVANVADTCDIGAFEVQNKRIYLPIIIKP